MLSRCQTRCSVADCGYLPRPSSMMHRLLFPPVLINRPQGFHGLIWPVVLYDLLLSFSSPSRLGSNSPDLIAPSCVHGEKRSSKVRDWHHLVLIMSPMRGRDTAWKRALNVYWVCLSSVFGQKQIIMCFLLLLIIIEARVKINGILFFFTISSHCSLISKHGAQTPVKTKNT